MKRTPAKQIGFELLGQSTKTEFGGSLLKGNHAKKKRVITTREPMHLVLRSEKAKGSLSLLKKRVAIENLATKIGRRVGVKIYRKAVAGNHIHLIILPMSRRSYVGFVRAFSGVVARIVLGIKRGKAKGIRFWDERPFTRVVKWGRDFRRACSYLLQNSLEALGFIEYQPRSRRPGLSGGRLSGPGP